MTLPVLCFDVDGTLVDAAGAIHPRDRELLSERPDVLFVPATGRPLHAVRRAFARNGLFRPGPIPLPLILQNGAVLYEPREKLLSVRPLPREIRHSLLDVAGRFSQVAALLFSHDAVHLLHGNAFSQRLIDRFDLATKPYSQAAAATPFTKFIFIGRDEAALTQIEEAVTHLPLEISRSLPTVMEINERGVDKRQGLLALVEALGVEPGPILAAGDGENDLPLLQLADASFCPAAGLPAVQDHVTHVIDRAANGVLAPMLSYLSRAEENRS